MAIVTGGASGIGRALGKALVERGDVVVLADVDGEGAALAAEALAPGGGGRATGVALDVRDAAAVESVVEETVRRHGRLDLMVNNAGIGMGGDAEELSVDHWDRVIDVNLRGVVHGVQAAYPRMVAQGHGHIVNTASLAGLIPGPRLAPYATTKWAVVGLSLSLRGEGAAKGVRVSVVCPGGVDTPILDKDMPADLPPVPSLDAMDGRAMVTRASGGRLHTADALAADVLRGIDRNRAFIVAPRRARVLWRMTRVSPTGVLRLMQAMTSREARARPAPAAGAPVEPAGVP
ncbi:MAG TPA: SDR family oxidoreductase [Pseudonocardia sp.]|nr:SDR family oxidoreductase [Pseudonocardia sp.]